MKNTVRQFGYLVVGALFVIGCGPATTSSKKVTDATKEGIGKVAEAAKEGVGKASDVAKEGVDKAASAAEAAKKAFIEQKDKFKAGVDKQVGDLDKKYEELKAKAKDAMGEAKTKLEAQLKTAEEKRKAINEHLGKLKDAGQEGWDKAEKGVNDAVDELKKALE